MLFNNKCIASPIVEKAYQQTKNLSDRLSFLYLASAEKCTKIQTMADTRGDPMLRFHNALYACNVLRHIAIFGDVGLHKHTPLAQSQDFTLRPRPLTYLTAKTNGLEEAAEIIQAAGLTEANMDDIPAFGKYTL
ncbi:hypothetical protein BD769DRAFT_1674016 [Suillus cothurnatus]|nr:hypothetical protein BD769DRAFT_1674016 [Suillus cothurnatus]